MVNGDEEIEIPMEAIWVSRGIALMMVSVASQGVAPVASCSSARASGGNGFQTKRGEKMFDKYKGIMTAGEREVRDPVRAKALWQAGVDAGQGFDGAGLEIERCILAATSADEVDVYHVTRSVDGLWVVAVCHGTAVDITD